MTTFDPANKGTDITLTNVNLSASNTNVAVGYETVLSTTSKTPTDAAYCEFVITTATNLVLFGICYNDQNVNDQIAAQGNAVYMDFTGQFHNNSIGVFSTPDNQRNAALAQGDVVGIAVDYPNGKAWFAKNNAWGDGSLGGPGVPATGANPHVTWTPGSSGIFVAVSCFGVVVSVITIVPDAAHQTYTAPSGFTSWDAATPTTPDVAGFVTNEW